MKKNMHFSKITAMITPLILTTFIPLMSFAEVYTTQEGFDKMKKNLENSKENQIEYSKNLDTVSKNLAEVSKAKALVQKQKDTVNQEILANNEAYKKAILQEKEIQQLIVQEKQKQDQERLQMEQLEKTMAQIRQNQVLRETLLMEYNTQLNLAQDEKKSWKARDTELRTQEAKTIQSLRGIASEEATWTNKKKGYEIEVKRWSSEVEKQKKISDTYDALKENK